MNQKKNRTAAVALILALVLIFALTFQNSGRSAELSGKVKMLLQRITGALGLDKSPNYYFYWSDVMVRKYAHTVEFFLLGIAAGFFFRKSKAGIVKGILLCAVVSILDQTVKGFVPEREIDWTDFPFDMLGYLSGNIIAALTALIVRCRHKEKKQKDPSV